MTMRILLVEDDAGVVETMRSTIVPATEFSLEVETDFAAALPKVESYRPDIIILDLYEDALGEDKGKPVWDRIWETSFCPIIFHTAHGAPATAATGHPFVKYVKKGPGSDRAVVTHLRTYAPHVAGVRDFGRQVEKQLQEVMKVVAPILWKAQNDSPANAAILTRAAKRRLAATIDDDETGATAISHWEQYIVPVIGTDPLMGDVLKAVGADGNDANSYRLTLTPSCDCVDRSGQVSHVLVAKCKPAIEFLRAAGINQAPEAKRREKLEALVTLDQKGGYVPLPALSGVMPALAVNLKELELIPIEEIGNSNKGGSKFERVVSIDSPFREKIAWAYIQISGRPGTPTCDPAHIIDSFARA